MSGLFVDPADTVDRQNEKLLKVVSALMRRVEQAGDERGEDYEYFQRALMLEEQVRERTRDLEQTLDLLNQSNARLSEASEAAQRARADLFNALEAVQEGFALFNADDVLVMCNSRFGMHMPDIKAHLRPGLSFQQYVHLVSQSRHLSLGEGETREAWAAKRRQNHKDHHVNFNVRIDETSWVQVSEHRTPSQGTAILQTDVTDMVRLERRERERLLDDQARLIRATLEHINQGICIFDSRHRLVWWNQRLEQLLHPPIDALQVGRGFGRLYRYLADTLGFRGGGSAATLRDWVEGAAGRSPLTLEALAGEQTHLAVFAQEMPDTGFVISFTDVTAERAAVRAVYAANESLERRVLERTLALEDALDEAERANASKSRFVAAASHDLLQPLSAAKLFLASLNGVEIGEDAGQVVQRTQSALNSVESILAALLDISKLDSGQAAVAVSSVRMDQLLCPLFDEFEPLARQKGLELRIVPSGLSVDSDPAYLRRILQNLIVNAIRYTSSGRVLVGARRRANTLRIEVWDTGPGISPEDQDIIFKEFQRLSDARGMCDGVGLGLAIVERACALLGHPLSLRSEQGRGTGFFVTVPVSRDQSAHTAAPTGDPTRSAETVDLLALVVEDDPTLRRALTTLLESWGVSVFDVAGHGEALSLVGAIEAVPDILLVDYQLAGETSGLETIAALREKHPRLPAILITADRTPDLRSRCREQGVEFVNKPIEPVALREMLFCLHRAR